MQGFRLDYRSMPKLIINGTTYELVDDVVTIGRGPDNAIIIDNSSVSARHAQLQLTGDTYRLKDLGSTNGTHVNGKPVTETLLRFDDRVRFGAAEARYESDASGSRPLPKLEEITARPAQLSAVPADFTNVSPFGRQRKESDPVRNGILIGLAIVLLVFLGSMVAVLMMHAPSP
jgi:predicted component of type VI protein secretion system